MWLWWTPPFILSVSFYCWSVEELWPGSHSNGERLAAVRRRILVLLLVFIPVIVRVNLLVISGLLALITWLGLHLQTSDG